MSLLLLAVGALVGWLWLTDRLSGPLLTRLIAGAIGMMALRLGFEGSPLGGIAMGALAVALYWRTRSTRKPTAIEAAHARALLGVGAEAGPDAIRAAYLRRASTAHPDRGGDVADMQALNAARDLLLRRARR